MTIPACLILDDFPINASYWAREQQWAFGFTPATGGAYGRNWRAQAVAAFCPIWVVEGFADLVEEYDLRGKFSVVACPAGLGRVDQSVRVAPPGYIEGVLDIVRRRIAPRFDITPEVLTHTMAYDPASGGLLPHTETAWLSHLAAAGRHEEITAYVDLAWRILHNVGLKPGGITVGGLPDPSNVANGQMLLAGHHRERFMPSVMGVLSRYQPEAKSMFLYTYGRATRQPYLTNGLPEPLVRAADGMVAYELLSHFEDPLLSVFDGTGDPIALADALVSPDLAGGLFIDCINSGKALMVNVHAQTLNALNTGLGLELLREALRRLHRRYGREIRWMTALELCALGGGGDEAPRV